MKSLLQKSRILFLFSAVFSASTYADKNIQEIIVTSDFREGLLKNIPTSISVIDAEVISQRNSNHLEQILALAPNVNFAAGASRGRYFQIRGIGERSQFVDPLNPSVGTYVDGIDFTGFGGAATLLDINQVEVLRGSQGTRFGANALAGVINLKTADPSAESKGYAKTSLSSYGRRNLETAFGGALNDQWLYRVAAGKTLSDGFISNTTLDRKDTNNIDELTSRLKLRYLANENLTVDFTSLHLDIDNGYDAFSLDENRNTLSDEPGHDRQDTSAFAINSDWTVSDALRINSIFTTNRSDTEYGYDEDWSHSELWSSSDRGWVYKVFDNYLRDVARDTAEVRFLSNSNETTSNNEWLLGVYFQNSSEGLVRDRSDDPEFNSQYDTSSGSIFMQANSQIKDKIKLTTGLRYEKWKSDYFGKKNNEEQSINGKSSENLLGGKLSLEVFNADNNLLYATLTRGYKAGGFNASFELPSESLRRFENEYQMNYEVGSKYYSANMKVSHHLTAFYSDRKNLQLKSSTQNSDLKWIDYITNAGKGYSYGFEWEMTWQLQDNLRIASSLGLLKTKVTQYNNLDSESFNLKNREVAHAPQYSFATSVQYALTDKLSATIELEGKDKFYYSDSHNYQSQAYNLINARLVYSVESYELTAFINNATDKEYGVRGFDFTGWDQDPRSGEGYDDVQFEQLGAPKVIGLSVRADF
jgi:outer membrane receptor protein involved in Fe transport